MKIFTTLLIAIALGSFTGYGGGAGAITLADHYSQSYAAAMRKQTAAGAEIRAENVRQRYEFCDEHHLCTEKAEKTVLGDSSVELSEQKKPLALFLITPSWQ